MAAYRSLQLHPLKSTVSYFEPSQELSGLVKEESPAILVMTDLRQQVAVTVEPHVSIDWALHRMKAAGVRLLFVVNTDKHVLGIITATDIQGEKPIRLHNERNLRHEEIMVRDIMTPHGELEVLHMDDILRASVGDIVATMIAVGRRHALVVDRDPRSSRQAIRGIYSISQISKQLNRPINTTDVAHTFAQVEMVLNS
jgi:CBS domain containing-hemolysin-like protein